MVFRWKILEVIINRKIDFFEKITFFLWKIFQITLSIVNTASFSIVFLLFFCFFFLQNFKFWNIGKMIKKITFFNKISSSYLWGFWRQFQRNVKKKSHFLTKFQVPTYGDFDVNFNEMWKMVLKKWVKLKWLRTCKHELAGSYYGRIL